MCGHIFSDICDHTHWTGLELAPIRCLLCLTMPACIVCNIEPGGGGTGDDEALPLPGFINAGAAEYRRPPGVGLVR